MSSDRIYLSAEEQNFLMYFFEIDDPQAALEKFVSFLVEQRAKPEDLKEYLGALMPKAKTQGFKW
jgi:hypothetical protein